MKYLALFLILSFSSLVCFSQEAEEEDAFQTVKGKVIDKDSKTPLWGAAILIVDSTSHLGAVTDSSGYFKIEKVPVGRQNIRITYVGYEDLLMQNVLVTSEQDISLNIQMTELTEKLAAVTIIAKLDNLIAPDAAPGKPDDDTEPTTAQKYPSITLTANQFEARGIKLGKLELRATQQGRNWNIETLRLENPDFTASMSGAWSNWRHNANTLLNVDMDIADIGKTLDRFGYPGTVKSGTGSIVGNVSWPDGPQAFSTTTLSGDLTLKAEKGQFLKIQSGVGKLLGIISLQNLPRRLLFDFRDVFSSGFSFDKISSNIYITQGLMRSENFVMEGASARVNMNGETDLAKETQHLHIKVTPAVSDSISLAAFAGGPAVGLAALLAQKLLQDPLNKIAAYDYDIVGTWDDPQEVKSSKKENPAVPAFSPLGQ